MNIIPYYPYYLHNVGRIESITDGILHVGLNRGRGIPDIDLPVSSCYNFQPQIHDRVLLCVDTDGDLHKRLLQKLPKTCQERNVQSAAKANRDVAETQQPKATA
jgi:hypothetical protein